MDEAKELLARIERDHRDDPQVAAALYQLLYETGVIPDKCQHIRTATRMLIRTTRPQRGCGRCSRAGGRPNLDARQRSTGRRQIGSVDTIVSRLGLRLIKISTLHSPEPLITSPA